MGAVIMGAAGVPASPRASEPRTPGAVALRLLPGILAAAWASTRPPFLSPDSFEAVAAGRCHLHLDPAAVCDTVERFMWPPAFPVLAGALSTVAGPRLAAVLVSLGAACLLAWPVTRIAERFGRVGAGLAAAVFVLAMPGIGFHALAGDARTLALLVGATAWAGALALPGAGSLGAPATPEARWQALLVGGAAGAAVWCRPEALAGALLLLAWVAARRRPAFVRTLAGFLVVAGAWWLTISLVRGRLTLLARGWEIGVLGWQDVIPLQWLFQLFGIGAGGSPVRTAILVEGAGGALPVASVLAGVAGVLAVLARAVPWPVWPLAVVGVAAAWRARGEREALFAPLALGGAAIAAACLPQAREQALPESNLLGALAALGILAGAGAAHLVRRWDAGTGLAAGLVAVSVWAVDLVSGPERPWPTGEARPVAAQAGRWLAEHTPADARIGASFESGGVRLAGRPLARFPSPWELDRWARSADRPAFVVVSAFDLPWVLGALTALAETGPLDPVSVHRDDTDWVLILAARDPDAR